MKNLRGVLCIGAVVLSACGVPDEFDGQLEFRTTFVQPGTTTLIANGLADPEVSGVDPSYSLSSPEGLSSNEGWLLGSDSLEMARYMVECALPAGDSVTKTVNDQEIVLDGLLGLAPEWKTDECNQDCQEWVSACLLARTNVSGEMVQIWVGGEHEALDSEGPEGTLLEGAFYGNLFNDPEGKYICEGSTHALVAARRQGRTCSNGSCGFTEYKNCHSHSRCTMDGPHGVPSNCKTGKHATSAPYHTIVTYVSPS